MARGLITANMTGLDELIASIEAIPETVDKAIEAGAKAMMEQGKDNLRSSYLAVGGKVGDYIYKSIGSYGTNSPSGSAGLSYWLSVGVFKDDSIYSAYNAQYQDNQTSEIKKNALSAAQIAYWIENGTSRIRSGGRKPRNFNENNFDPNNLIKIQPKPFISNAYITGWPAQLEAFTVEFNKKIEELT